MYSYSMLSAVLFASFVMQAHQKFQNGHIPNAVIVRIHGICAVFLLQTLERNAIIHLFKKLAKDCHLKSKVCYLLLFFFGLIRQSNLYLCVTLQLRATLDHSFIHLVVNFKTRNRATEIPAHSNASL
jgi:uncharacterized membrane protein required for colicin V production